jgi:hypothetical protein
MGKIDKSAVPAEALFWPEAQKLRTVSSRDAERTVAGAMCGAHLSYRLVTR